MQTSIYEVGTDGIGFVRLKDAKDAMQQPGRAAMLDPLIVAKQLQNMFVAVLPGTGGHKAPQPA